MKIKLTDDQTKKIIANSNKKLGSRIRLKPQQIDVGKEYPLTNKQIEDLKEAKKNGKSVLLNLSITQLKTGGFLPLLFAGIGAAAALATGVSSVANAYFDKKDKDKIRAEKERHDKAMEKIIAEKAASVHVGSNLRKKKAQKKVHFKK